MRRSVVVMLLALVLAGCSVKAVPGGPSPSSDLPTTTADTVAVANTAPADPPTTAGTTSSDDSTPVSSSTRAVPDSRTGDERTAVTIVNAFWKSWFAAHHRRYTPPRVAGGYTGRGGPSCGGEPSVPGNAYYCPEGNFLAWDEDLMRAGYRQIGDAWVYLVIAHEWGHAIQGQLPRRYVSRAIELQADCLAGAALQGAEDENLVQVEPGDAQEIREGLEAVADDYPWTDSSSHGDAQQRIGAFQGGVSGGVDACLRR